jgi:hypothetical protein
MQAEGTAPAGRQIVGARCASSGIGLALVQEHVKFHRGCSALRFVSLLRFSSIYRLGQKNWWKLEPRSYAPTAD